VFATSLCFLEFSNVVNACSKCCKHMFVLLHYFFTNVGNIFLHEFSNILEKFVVALIAFFLKYCDVFYGCNIFLKNVP
jgi:hypothetical protein